MDIDLFLKFVLVVAPAMAVCAATLVVVGRSRMLRDAAVPLALGMAFMAGFAVIERGIPGWPPNERWKWLAWMNVTVTLLATIAALWRPGRAGRLLVYAGLTAILAAMLHPTARSESAVVLKVAAGVMAFITGFAIDGLGSAKRAPLMPMTFALAFGGAASVTYHAGFGTLSLLISATCMAMLVVAARGWFAPTADFGLGGLAWSAGMLAAFMGVAIDDGYNTGHVPRVSFALVAVAPLMLVVGESRTIKARSAVIAFGIRLALVALPVVTGVVVATRSV